MQAPRGGGGPYEVNSTLSRCRSTEPSQIPRTYPAPAPAPGGAAATATTEEELAEDGFAHDFANGWDLAERSYSGSTRNSWPRS